MSLLSVDTNALLAIVVPAVIAALGYVGNLIVVGIRGWRVEKEQRRSRLYELQSLLRASWTAFVVQQEVADRLLNELRAAGDPELVGLKGRERTLTRSYDRLNEEQKEQHTIVRAYSQYALKPLDEALLAWIEADDHFRIRSGKTGAKADLADELNVLHAHLLLWLAKFQAWIPDNPEHALVYLDDEGKHGLGFPSGVSGALARVLGEDSSD